MAVAAEKLQGLQKRLDEKLINPKDLNVKQKVALDKALKSGQLKGYKGGVAEMYAERNLARKTVATDIREKLAPLTPKSTFGLGLTRGTMVAAGDIIGSFAPYIMDHKRLAVEARAAALAGGRVRYAPSLVKQSAGNTFKAFSNLIGKLPVLKNLKLFKNTGKVLDGFHALIRGGGNQAARAAGLITSQALRTELKSQAIGALGAGAGSVAYDTINFPAKLAVSIGEDLSGIDKNQYAQMNPVTRTAYHAVANMGNALLWNAGAFGLFGGGRKVILGMKKMAKLDPIHQRKINELIIDQGIPLNIVQLAEGTGGFSGLIKGINQIVSVVPMGAGVPKAAQAKFTGAALLALQGNLAKQTNVPLLHAEALANALHNTIKKVYTESGQVVGQMYKAQDDKLVGISELLNKQIDDIAARTASKGGQAGTKESIAKARDQILKQYEMSGGAEIPFISTQNLRSTVTRIKGDLEKGFINAGDDKRILIAGLKGEALDPVNKFIRYMDDELNTLAGLQNNNGVAYITPWQFNAMRRNWNKNYVDTFANSSDPIHGRILEVLRAFEQDLNNVVKMPGIEATIKGNEFLGKAHHMIKSELGPQRADDFIKNFQRQYSQATQDYIDANESFSQVISFYNNSNMAKIVRSIDPAELTAMQSLNVTGRGPLNNVKAMDQLFKAGFSSKTGTSEGVEELYNLLGGATYFGKSPKIQARARYSMNLLMYRKMFDAFNGNAIVRAKPLGGSEVIEEPFKTLGPNNLSEVIEVMNKNSPHFRQTTEEILNTYNKSGRPSAWLKQTVRAQKASLDVDMLRKAIEDGVPITERILINREVQAGAKTSIAAKPIDMDVVGARKILATGKIPDPTKGKGYRLITEPERRKIVQNLDTLSMRLGAYEGFKFDQFETALGIGTKEGREQLVKGFEIGSGLTNKAAREHVDNLQTIIAALKRNAQAPIGDSNKYLLRSLIFKMGAGAGLGVASFMAGGPLGVAMTYMMIRGGAHFFNSPALAKRWLDLYTVAERLEINRIQALTPTRQAIFADLFNYAFGDDPDRPIVAPGNIPEEKIIEYLQNKETVQVVPTAEGLYHSLPDETKMRFDPTLQGLNQMSAANFDNVKSFGQGMSIANERSDLIDAVETDPQVAGAVTPQAKQFIENPAARVPDAVQKGMNAAQGIQPTPQTSNMYKAMFPGDSLGAAIAERRAAGEKLPYNT